jgi:hypothetical protein
MGVMRSGYTILVGKPEGKRQLVRHSCRWDSYIMLMINRA